MSGWRTHSSRIVYDNPWIRVREDQVTRPDGNPGRYGVVEVKHPSVFVVALTEDDEVVLVEVYRYPLQRTSWEIPAGGSDGEPPLAAAQRELREETGLAASDWQEIGQMSALNGVCSAPEHVFLARGLSLVGGVGAAEEGIIGSRRLRWAEVWDLIASGGIDDGETIAALGFAAVALGRIG